MSRTISCQHLNRKNTLPFPLFRKSVLIFFTYARTRRNVPQIRISQNCETMVILRLGISHSRYENIERSNKCYLIRPRSGFSAEDIIFVAMLNHFGIKPFLKQWSQGFEQLSLIYSFGHEERSCLQTNSLVLISNVSSSFNKTEDCQQPNCINSETKS